jgi:hypothetical protein
MKKIILVCLSTFILTGCNRLDIHQPRTSTVTQIQQGQSITQSFQSSRNNLNSVNICLRNPNRILIPLTFVLMQGEEVIRTLDFSSGNIDVEDCTRFKFVPVENSAGKTYIAVIKTYPPAEGVLSPPTISVEKYDTDLHYKTFFYQPLKEVVQESLGQFYKRLFQDKFFILLWGGAVIYLIVRLLKKSS